MSQRFFLRGVLFCFFVVFTAFGKLSSEPLKMSVKADSVILINAKTGKVLFCKNESKKQFVASTTKIATCIYAIEQGRNLLDTKFIAGAEALRTVSPYEKRRDNYAKYPSHFLESDASHIGLKNGEEVPFRDLLYGVMLASGDDAANVIAEHFGQGSISDFMADLNAYLQNLGVQNSYFCNPSGLHHPEHVSTAKDLALLSRHAMKNDLFRQIVATKSYEKKATNKQPATTFYQSNRLLRRGPLYYPYAIGIKTGWHSSGLHSLVVAAEKEGRLLIGVLLRSEDRQEMFREAKMLLEKAFTQKKVEKEVVAQGMQPFERTIEGGDKPLLTYSKVPLVVSYYPAEEPQFRCLLTWDKVELPIAQGQKVGERKLVEGDEVYAVLPLFAKEQLERSFFALIQQKAMHFITSPLSLIALAAIALLLLYTYFKR